MSRADIKAELEAFVKSGKAKIEVNSGNFVTTHIDVLKVAEHFYEQAEKDFKNWTEEDKKVFEYLKGGFEYNGKPLGNNNTIMPGLTVGMYRSFIKKIESLLEL